MKQKIPAAIVLISAVVAGIFLFTRHGNRLEIEPIHSDAGSKIEPETIAVPSGNPEPAIVPPTHAPTVERVRQEVKQNPHALPPSLIDFSAKIASLMQKALNSSKEAAEALPKLRGCALAPSADLVESARASCLVNIGRLAKKFPELKHEHESILSAADPRVSAIAKAIEAR